MGNIVESGIIPLDRFTDERGSLIVLEEYQQVPFDIKRVYYIYQTKPAHPRGFHAMKDSLQVMICLHGSCEVVLDDGEKKQSYLLDTLQTGLYIDKLIWHEMYNFTEDCVLLVLSDALFDEKDNIRSYEEFIKIRKSEECKFETNSKK